MSLEFQHVRQQWHWRWGGNVGNVNLAGESPTTAASSTSRSSSAPWPAAKQRLETGTVLLEFLPGGEVVNLDVDLVYMY